MEIAEVLSGFRRIFVLRLLIVGVRIRAGRDFGLFHRNRKARRSLGRSGGPGGAGSGQRAQREPPIGRRLSGSSRTSLEDHALTSRDFFVLAEMYATRCGPWGKHRCRTSLSWKVISIVAASHFPSWVTPGTTRRSSKAPLSSGHGPLAGGDGKSVGWFEGTIGCRRKPYAVRPISCGFALTVGVVLMTAAVLYPLMATLQGAHRRGGQRAAEGQIDTLRFWQRHRQARQRTTRPQLPGHDLRRPDRRGHGAQRVGDPQPDQGSFLDDVGKFDSRRDPAEAGQAGRR